MLLGVQLLPLPDESLPIAAAVAAETQFDGGRTSLRPFLAQTQVSVRRVLAGDRRIVVGRHRLRLHCPSVT